LRKTNIFLAKQKISSYETKINSNREKRIIFLYYIVNKVYAIKHFNWKC